ncbi:MAG: hypothetical protein A2Z15_03975 [Chloroflexi bacterium RBG_16_50_11]|nr:MAG: hypothetical protein A2Z15_03975 [Chloroflexi bacterium RBG_16_50_11]
MENAGKNELARVLLLLGSGSMGQTLGHSVSCTAFILLESWSIRRKTPGRRWPRWRTISAKASSTP